MLPVINLIENSPVAHQARTPCAIQRLVQRFPKPVRVLRQRPRNEIHRTSRNIRRQVTGNGSPSWWRKSYFPGVGGLSHAAR
jgi:hypothetical protein